MASSWLKEFKYTLSTGALWNAVPKKHDEINKVVRGGVTYTYIILWDMFQMSYKIKVSMLLYIELLKRIHCILTLSYLAVTNRLTYESILGFNLD